MPLVHGQYPPFSEEALRNGSTLQSGGNPIRSTMGRMAAVTDNAVGATGVMHSTAIALQAGDLVTNITFVSGATAADTPTHWFFALYSNAATPALLGQTADKTTTAWAANTAKTLALATPYQVTTAGIYYVSVAMAATAVVTLAGATLLSVAAAAVTGQKVLAQTSGTGLTGTAPATIATPTTVQTPCYAVVS